MKSFFFFLMLMGVVSVWAVPAERVCVRVDPLKSIQGKNCNIGNQELKILLERIRSNVVSSRKYHILEREDLKGLQEELKLVDAGLTEGRSPDSNKLKAAGYRISGTVVQYRYWTQVASSGTSSAKWVYGSVELKLTFSNIENGEQLADKTILVDYTNFPKCKSSTNAVKSDMDLGLEVMTDAVREAAKQVVSVLNEIAFPVYVTDVDGKFVTGNISAEQVSIGDTWEIWKRRGPKINPETEKMDGYREKLVCAVKVSRPGPKETKFEVLNTQDGKELEEIFDSISSLPVAKMKEKGLILRKAPDSSVGNKPQEPSLDDWRD